jgi:PHD/YefM family antitoxin component YafN of YafNO toxin-antitoxin module
MRYGGRMAIPERLPAAAARTELSAILRAFAEMAEPADSIGDRAVRIGAYNRDTAVLVPLSDFERALETEELLEDLLLEITIAERLARGPGKLLSLEEVARELGLADELGLD